VQPWFHFPLLPLKGRAAERPLSESLDVGAIFREHGRYVHRLLRRLGVAPAEVDDAFQEVFVVVHRKLDSFEGRGPVRAWVHGIAVRVSVRYRRRRNASPEVASGDELDAIDLRTPAECLSAQEAREILGAILDRLDDDKRTVFVLYELEGLTMQEVAQSMNSPVQTAYSRLHAAREIVYDAVRRHQLRRDFK
jgi:RNA polymerase sigma-70 factor, ECF subfamily